MPSKWCGGSKKHGGHPGRHRVSNAAAVSGIKDLKVPWQNPGVREMEGQKDLGRKSILSDLCTCEEGERGPINLRAYL